MSESIERLFKLMKELREHVTGPNGQPGLGHRATNMILHDALNAIDDELADHEVRIRELEAARPTEPSR
jgi:hypothetical protein